MTALAPILQEFFTAHLVGQRAVSAATIRAYRDTWRLFLAFLSGREHVPAYRLETSHVNADEVIAFLDYLETDRGNSVATRNLRLAAIKATMAFHATRAPEALDTIARIHTIPVKKYPRPEVTFLTHGETQALLDAITADTWTGRRDRAMFTLAIQTGLRLGEITELSLTSVHLGAAPHVSCTGKGRKTRTTPLTSTTASLLKAYTHERSARPGEAFFPNPHGCPLSADAVQRRLALHLVNAASTCPGIANKHVTVHTLRHTAAMRFLEAGVDAAVIALWLGHESQATTSIYLHADIDIKRRALERTRQPNTRVGEYHPADPLLTWLQGL
ncbi:integrase [Mycobacterium sp. ENV421]|uniref:tyrosine-type recombinase/integrase n=1 Tax=Mycobacterium sp. ENV421 TaxID=1213407 RepID=UPI000C9A6217|nr:tyrosine-type recombinase/integrase [Mycobacterium sp. ENV421]PND54122.1 integrase [Mycobacterium sp. ENV421]